METKKSMWVIIELFGHSRIAGLMSEEVIGGQSFIRVDVPELATADGEVIAAHTKMFGAGAIYAINLVDEAIATAAASEIRHAPVSSYGLQSALRNMPEDHRQRLLSLSEIDEIPF